uniref:Mitofilin n=1 Tax=Soboliphyme baturini TaxID=241478 RepID=A0A183J3K0_9BILA
LVFIFRTSTTENKLYDNGNADSHEKEILESNRKFLDAENLHDEPQLPVSEDNTLTGSDIEDQSPNQSCNSIKLVSVSGGQLFVSPAEENMISTVNRTESTKEPHSSLVSVSTTECHLSEEEILQRHCEQEKQEKLLAEWKELDMMEKMLRMEIDGKDLRIRDCDNMIKKFKDETQEMSERALVYESAGRTMAALWNNLTKISAQYEQNQVVLKEAVRNGEKVLEKSQDRFRRLKDYVTEVIKSAHDETEKMKREKEANIFALKAKVRKSELESDALEKEIQHLSSGLQNYLLGFSVRVVVSTVLLPPTVIKTRFESATYSYPSVLAAARDIVKNEKVWGLYSGGLPTVLRDAPYSGIYLAFYRLHLSLVPEGMFAACSAIAFFVCAASSSFLACVLTQPLDMVKTQMQLLPLQNRSFLLTLLRIAKTTGVMSLFDGLGPRVLRKCLMTASNWTIFEEVDSNCPLQFAYIIFKITHFQVSLFHDRKT